MDISQVPVTTTPSDAGAAVAARRNFARSAEESAAAGLPGFESYLAASAQAPEPRAVMGPKANLSAPQMSYEDSDFSFGDLVDVLNPLQHIPVIGTLYRAATGDEIKPASQVAGDILFGGGIASLGTLVLGSVVTALVSTQNAVHGQETGKPLDRQVADAVFNTGKTAADAAPVQTAAVDSKLPAQAVLAAQAKTAASTQETQARTLAATQGKPEKLASAAPVLATPSMQERPSVAEVRKKLAAASGATSSLTPSLSAAAAHALVTAGPLTPQRLVPEKLEETKEALASAATGTDNSTTGALAEAPVKPAVKQPYGGAMDMGLVQAGQKAQTGGSMIGGQFHPELNAAAHAARARAHYAAPLTKAAGTSTPDAAPEIPVVNSGAVGSAPVETAATTPSAATTGSTAQAPLGQLMHDSAHKAELAAQTGTKNPLPPELVQDMMLMALDKYKAANLPLPPTEN